MNDIATPKGFLGCKHSFKLLNVSNFHLFHSSDVKSKVAKSEEVVADSSQQVTSTPITGAEAYDTSYSSAAAAYSASMSAYSYAAPSQSQWAAYSSYNAAHPVRFDFS